MNDFTKKIETNNLILEPLSIEHAEKLYNGYCDESIYEFIECEVPESLDWLKDLFKILETGEFTNRKGVHMQILDWAIYSKFEREYIGRCDYTIYDNGDCNVGYVFFSPYWRKGYSYEAVCETFQFVKKLNIVNKFIIECDSLNVGSMRIAQKLNFKYVETKFNATKLKNRMGHDHCFTYDSSEIDYSLVT
jgi:RimJ/RimL family protein N-acetyltransferase